MAHLVHQRRLPDVKAADGHHSHHGQGSSMPKLVYLTPTFAVTAALVDGDFAELARVGAVAVISNRPDDEVGAKLTARAEAACAWRAGLKFAHVPAPKHDVFTDAVVEGMAAVLARFEAQGLIVAHCVSGLRSAIVWAAASARSQPVDCVLAALRRAGFDLDMLRDDLEAQADRRRWLGSPRALDCGERASEISRAVVQLSA